MQDQVENPLLQQLRDIHMPAEVTWWPPAIGWWALALIVGVVVYRLLRRWQHQFNQNRYRKSALLELDSYLLSWQRDDNDSAYLQAAHALLRRICLHLQDGQNLSTQTGQQWADNINRHSTQVLDRESIMALTHAAYRKNPAVDIEALHKSITNWIKKHKRNPLENVQDTAKQEPDYA